MAVTAWLRGQSQPPKNLETHVAMLFLCRYSRCRVSEEASIVHAHTESRHRCTPGDAFAERRRTAASQANGCGTLHVLIAYCEFATFSM